MNIKSPKKLIEVALPLDDINVAAAKEKSIRHGHPSTLHLWWARRPLAAARAVIFAQMVNDPGYDRSLKRGLKKDEALKERERLFQIIRDLVIWENTNNEEVLDRARAEIIKSWHETCELNKNHPHATELFNPDKLPAFHDPFAGGGAIPLEAQRLGLVSYASDLNPVAVMINKAMIEIPSKFVGRPPVCPMPEVEKRLGNWSGANGLAEDVRYYAQWIRQEVEKQIGHLYPKVEITSEVVQHRPELKHLTGKKLTVIAWIWARTVKSPNPAFANIDVPLTSTFVLSSKKEEGAWVEPIISGDQYKFVVKVGAIPSSAETGTKSEGKGSSFQCLLSRTPILGDYIKKEGQAGRLGLRLMAIVVDTDRGRVYLSPNALKDEVICSVEPAWQPELDLVGKSADQLPLYGFKKYSDLFTKRQLIVMATFSELIRESVGRIHQDALVGGFKDDGRGLEEGGTGALAYAEAVASLLGLILSRTANTLNSFCLWSTGRNQSVNLFSRQAISMVWDFPEVNPFAGAAGDFIISAMSFSKTLAATKPTQTSFVLQADARNQKISEGKLISTDPPYYDNVCYADLSDFFYVWLRHSLKSFYPNLFSTLAVPKESELIASFYRHGNRNLARQFFLDGMTEALTNLINQANEAFPVTLYYAFQQSETETKGTSSTGWEAFLEALLSAGYCVTGTWPMRTERPTGVKVKTNSLASSIILVCRKRSSVALTISRRDFLRELNGVLPEALIDMTRGEKNSPVAPVDLSQSIIGPGMAIFSRYAAVLEADGKPMSVRTALQLINRFLAEDDFDHDTQFCLHWFEAFDWSEDKFGEADVLARAKGTTVDGVRESGVIEAKAGKVRLLKFSEYPADWNPATDKRIPVWEALHHLIRALRSGGESVAGFLLSRMITKSEAIRQLAYRLYTLCERKGWADDARAYNELITSWEAIESASHAAENAEKQKDLFNTGEVNVA